MKTKKTSEEILDQDNKNRIVSEMGNKPNSRSDEIKEQAPSDLQWQQTTDLASKNTHF